MKDEEMRDYLLKIKDDKAECEKFIESNAILVQMVVRKIMKSYAIHEGYYEDLTSAGQIGLIKTIYEFDPSTKSSFRTLALKNISAEVKEEIRSIRIKGGLTKRDSDTVAYIGSGPEFNAVLEEALRKLNPDEEFVVEILHNSDPNIRLEDMVGMFGDGYEGYALDTVMSAYDKIATHLIENDQYKPLDKGKAKRLA